MTKYEELIGEYEHLIIEERPMVNDGLYADGCVWINQDMPTNKKACVLAEEVGHYETSSGDILRKQELTARKWAYNKVVPEEKISEAISAGYTEVWEIADHLDVDEQFLREALKYYGILDI